MPTASYETLLTETRPEIIETWKQYQTIGTPPWRPRRHAMLPDDSTPADRLQFLLEHSGKTSADLLPVFGQRSHVHEALTGKRAISAPQARRLGQRFHLHTGLFL
jgi:hypothetical protein